MRKQNKHQLVKRDPTVEALTARIEAMEATYASQIERLSKQVNILSQALRMSHDRTSHVINEFGLDVPERLRPRR